ncbi:hypothetical protein C8F01DRAFT_991558 [Mycena amicta]|nr:hypothetical protein C8F01DRAFT_991558 [Mycena amicta]
MLSNPFRRALQLRPRISLPHPARPSIQTHRRPYLVYSPRPATWSARLWYRLDGSPRSKIRGLVFSALSFLSLSLKVWSTLLVVEALDYEHYLLSTLVYIQRVDYEYLSVPFSDLPRALAYFEELVGYFVQGDVPPEMLAAFFQDLGLLAESSGMHEKIHTIIRESAGAVHELLLERKGEHPVDTAALAIDTLDTAMLALIVLVDEHNAGGDGTDKIRVKRLKDQMSSKDSSKSYEVLG